MMNNSSEALKEYAVKLGWKIWVYAINKPDKDFPELPPMQTGTGYVLRAPNGVPFVRGVPVEANPTTTVYGASEDILSAMVSYTFTYRHSESEAWEDLPTIPEIIEAYAQYSM